MPAPRVSSCRALDGVPTGRERWERPERIPSLPTPPPAPRTVLPLALGPASQDSGSHPSSTNWFWGDSQAGSSPDTRVLHSRHRPQESGLRADTGQVSPGRAGGEVLVTQRSTPSHGSAGTQSADRQTEVGGRQRAGITPTGLGLPPGFSENP